MGNPAIEHLAERAPITYDIVARGYGGPMGNTDEERAVFFAIWALLSFEWAEAMLAQAHRWPIAATPSTPDRGED